MEGNLLQELQIHKIDLLNCLYQACLTEPTFDFECNGSDFPFKKRRISRAQAASLVDQWLYETEVEIKEGGVGVQEAQELRDEFIDNYLAEYNDYGVDPFGLAFYLENRG
jgi:hypothetical protein